MVRVADYVIKRLRLEGVCHIFMVTGRGILYLSDAVAKDEQMEAICVHHEQAAAYAAVGYAQINQKIGACLVSTGCAATNALTGVLCAYQDSVPCIVISGQHILNETTYYTHANIRTYGSQEANIIEIVKPITKYAVMVTNPEDIGRVMDEALYHMQNGRKGPVWIDIPVDVQNMRVDEDKLEHFFPEIVKPILEDIQEVTNVLNNAKRPAVLIGSGIRSAGAIDELVRFLNKTNMPLVYAPSAADCIGSAWDMSIGAVGSIGGTREGNFVVQNADALLVLGCSLSSELTGTKEALFARNAKVIVVDIDDEQHKKGNIDIDSYIHSDVNTFLQKMNKQSFSATNVEWIEKCRHWKRIFPLGKGCVSEGEKIDLYYLAENLSDKVPNDCIVLCDAGYEELIIPAASHFKIGQRCVHPASQGAMGFALPAAIGCFFASNAPVLAIIGDGSIMMNIQELQTIAYYDLPIKIIVINNNMYSVIRKRQHDLFRERTIGTDAENGVSAPNFKRVADAFKLPYYRIPNVGEFNRNFETYVNQEGKMILELDCPYEQRYLHTSIGKNSRNRLIKKPLEDLSPFLGLEVMRKEMIVDILE